jgi:AraC-like DNA-binding protein
MPDASQPMLYLEWKPKPPLDAFVRTLWYARSPIPACHRERVLPSGCLQIVINLAANHLTDCGPDGSLTRPMAPAIVAGIRSTGEIIDGADLTELMGILFQPGGSSPFFACPVDIFRDSQIPLDDVWQNDRGSLRDRLCSATTPRAKFLVLEQVLLAHSSGRLQRNPAVDFALKQFFAPGGLSIAAAAGQIGLSERRFSQIFSRDVGVTPKLFCRIQRFRYAVRQMNAGHPPRWAELAMECGYYDQAHFANDFHAFSGIAPSAYLANRGVWQGHVKIPT